VENQQMPGKINISELRFGRLIALEPTEKRSAGKTVWRCKCDCGNECLAAVDHLRDGRRISCGCAKFGKQFNKKHGHYVGGKPTAIYRSWSSMRTRCFNSNVREYPNYGGRGITVCERWNTFENFPADMGPKPTPWHSLDRWPDVEKSERKKALQRQRDKAGRFMT
jgi:hypothetical protein